MKHRCYFISLLAGILLLVGCAPTGILYTHTKVPLDTNMSRTTAEGQGAVGDVKHISFYVDVMWDSNAIGDIAKQNGIETIYYSDLEILRVLTVWNQYTVHVYGK